MTFADFLAAFEPASGLPYLPDVARMEWRVQQVYGMADAPKQDLSMLAETTPDHWGDLHFRLDTAHALLKSDWPLARIWEVNQPAYQGDFEVDFEVAQTVLIHRRPEGTAVEALTPAETEFLFALADDEPLEAAVARASIKTGFDLAATLQRCLGNGLLRQAYLT